MVTQRPLTKGVLFAPSDTEVTGDVRKISDVTGASDIQAGNNRGFSRRTLRQVG
jgi:hypothetical protein